MTAVTSIKVSGVFVNGDIILSGPGVSQNGQTISFSGTGTGAVDSVNGMTGVVTLTTANVSDSSNKRYVTDAQLTILGNTSGTNTGDQTSVTGNAGTATALLNARTIGGVSFDGTANITVATATAGFTISGGNLALGTNSITMSGSIGVTGTRVTKGWFTDLEVSSMPTVGGTSLSSTFQPLDADLTTIAGLTATTDNFIVSVSSAWASRTPAQVKTTLSLNNVENTALSTWAGSTNLVTLGAASATSITSSGENVLSTGSNIKLTVPTGDLTATGFINADFNSGYSSSAIGDLVYLDSASTWQKCDANTLALYNGLLGIALEVKASGAALRVALPGSFIYSTTGFPTWTIGSPIYMSETAGSMTQTQPTTTDAAIRIVGWGVHADKMYFYPSPDYITHI